MEFKQRYKNLNHALKYLKVQVIDSLPYAYNKLPKFKTPEEIFHYLKQRTCYKHDPKGIELFQTLPTLMEKNFHGKTGYGDCDCFTIASLACLVANGFDNCGIVLVGRNPDTPVHIYAYVIYNGKKQYLDLTNKYFNYERSYPYKQSIPLVLTKNDKQKMYLQLASNGKPQRKMLYLPNSRAYVPEAHLDSYHVNDFSRLLGDNGFTLEEITDLAAKREKRKKADKGPNRRTRKKSAKETNKNEKKKAKVEKKKAKVDNKKAKADLKRAKAQKKLLVGQSKVDKANRTGGEGEEDNISKFTRIFDSAGNAVANVKNKFSGSDSAGGSDDEGDTPSSGGSSNDGKARKVKKEEDGIFSGSFDIMGMEIPKPVAYIGGLALAYGGYKLATRKK